MLLSVMKMFMFIECNLLRPDLVIQPETHTDLNICSELGRVKKKTYASFCHVYSFTSKLDSEDWEKSELSLYTS